MLATRKPSPNMFMEAAKTSETISQAMVTNFAGEGLSNSQADAIIELTAK
jgi:hypothetical protein